MNGSSQNVAVPPIFGLSRRHAALALSTCLTIGAFLIGAGLGGDSADPTLRPVVRFLAVVVGALGFAVAIGAGLHVTRSRSCWSVGQAGAAVIGLGAGSLWSNSAFGVGFACIVIGFVCCGLVAAKELERRDRHRSPRGG